VIKHQYRLLRYELADLQHYTRKVAPLDVDNSPGRLIKEHFQALESEFTRHGGHANNQLPGATYEAVLYDAMVQAGIPPECIHMAKRNVLKGDADFLVGNPIREQSSIILAAKTSLRERWKQWYWDYAALRFIERLPIETHFYGLFAREHPQWTDQQNIDLAARTTTTLNYLVSNITCVTTKDESRTNKLFDEIFMLTKGTL